MRWWCVAVLALTSCERTFDDNCSPLVRPSEAIELTTPPFVQVRQRHLRIRFETPELVTAPITIVKDGERCTTAIVADVDQQARTWAKPEDPAAAERPDVAGDYTLHTGKIEGLEPGALYDWAVYTGPAEEDVITGTLRAPPAAGTAATVAFVGRFAPPAQAQVMQALGEADVVLLGGDFVDKDVDESTWTRMANDIFPSGFSGLIHTVPGDRDDLRPAAMDEVYLRWFGGQGRPGGTDRYYSVDIAGVRIITLDGEDERLSIEGGAQWRWLEAELDDIAIDDGLQQAIVVMHKGPYSLTERVPNSDLRTDLLPKLIESGVRLVLASDGEAYERFEVDGLTIINEGGGGAALGDPDHRVDRDLDAVDARVMSDASFGGVRISIAEDGSMELVRVGADGETDDTVSWGAPE
ncbi:MAG: metallophosphoesterase [Myxococcota bacterium]